jgi:competence protein ComEC
MVIIWLAVAWLAGIMLGSLLPADPLAWVGVAVSLGAAAAYWRRQPVSLALACGAILCLGAARYCAALPTIDASHVAAYNHQGQVRLTGVVVAEPDEQPTFTRLLLRAETVALSGQAEQPVSGLVQVIAPTLPARGYGDRLLLEGTLRQPPRRNDFDYRLYLARQGVFSQIEPERPIVRLAPGQASPIRQALVALKERTRAAVNRLLPGPEAALLNGMLLGEERDLAPALVRAFRQTSTSHILVISGYQITLIAGVLVRAGQPLVGRRAAGWLALLGILLYTLLVGAGASVLRAGVMGGLLIIAATLIGRPTFAPASLFSAALLMTAARPFILWDIGFQLSFAATLGIMLYQQPLSDHLLGGPTPGPPLAAVARPFAEALVVTIAAQVFTLPLLIGYFQTISPAALATNLLVVPAQPAIMLVGGVAALVALLAPPLGQIIAYAAWPFLAYMTAVVELFARLPHATVPVNAPTALVVLLIGAILGLTWLVAQRDESSGLRAWLRQRRLRPAALVAGLLLALLLLAWLLTQPDGRLHVTFLDVGQGDAIFIETPSGRQILVDGGQNPALLADHLGRRIPFWDHTLDVVVATHPDADHVQGLSAVFDRYRVQSFLTNGQPSPDPAASSVLAAAGETPIHSARAGDSLTLGDGVTIEVLAPAGPAAGLSDNDSSVVLRLAYGDFNLLLTGDAGAAAETELLRSGQPLQAMVLKAGHHGSNTSSSAAFLAAVRPTYVIISAGAGNDFGHPAPAMVERAAAVGATVLSTIELGTIEVVSDGRRLWWQADPAPALP